VDLKVWEATESWRKLHNQELQNFYASPITVKVSNQGG